LGVVAGLESAMQPSNLVTKIATEIKTLAAQ